METYNEPSRKPLVIRLCRQDCLEKPWNCWGWTPISNGSRSDALDRRIYREVFPNSAWFKP